LLRQDFTDNLGCGVDKTFILRTWLTTGDAGSGVKFTIEGDIHSMLRH